MLKYEKHQLDADIQNSFHLAFPEAKVIVDAPLQMQRNLAEMRHARGVTDPADFLPLLAKAAPVFSQPEPVKIQSMRYENGGLSVDVLLRGSQQPELLRDRLQSAGLKVSLEKTEASNPAGTVAHLMLKGEI